MMLKKWMMALLLAGVVVVAGTGQTFAATKIAVIDYQAILSQSDAGKATKGKLENRMQELQAEFKADQEEMAGLQEEINKKSSAWSEATTKEKTLELRKMRRDLQLKNEDARVELKQLQDAELKPILTSLKKVVDEYGKKNGYTAILEKNSSVVYFDKSIEITDAIVKELNSAMGK